MIIIKIINKSATAPTQTQKVINGVKPIDEANFSINSLITSGTHVGTVSSTKNIIESSLK